METIKYWKLVEQIPKGNFYHEKFIPFKFDVYTIKVLTLYPLTNYDVNINNIIYHLQTDLAGNIEIKIHLFLGKNILQWRKTGTAAWKSKEIITSNLGTLISGIAHGMKDLNIDFSTSWELLYGLDKFSITPEQLEEIVQAFWNFTEKRKFIRQVSGALNHIPVTIQEIGNFILRTNWLSGKKVIQGGLYNYIYNHIDFGTVLNVTGGSGVRIFLEIEFGKQENKGQWIFKIHSRWAGAGSGSIGLGYCIDGVNWIWSETFNLFFNWQEFLISSPIKPVKVGIKFINASSDFSVDFGHMFLKNEEIKLTLPMVLDKKSIAVWSWV